MIRILFILLKFHKNFDFKDFDQNSSVFQSENLMTMEFLWNSRKLQEKFNQYSDQKIRWPRNSYEILENYRKSLDIPKIPTSAYSSKTFSSLFLTIIISLFPPQSLISISCTGLNVVPRNLPSLTIKACLRTIYSATTFLENCREVVLKKWFLKPGFFFWSTTFLQLEKIWIYGIKPPLFLVNHFSRTRFLEPLFTNDFSPPF